MGSGRRGVFQDLVNILLKTEHSWFGNKLIGAYSQLGGTGTGGAANLSRNTVPENTATYLQETTSGASTAPSADPSRKQATVADSPSQMRNTVPESPPQVTTSGASAGPSTCTSQAAVAGQGGVISSDSPAQEDELGGSDGKLCDEVECETNNFARGFWELQNGDASKNFETFNGDGTVIAILDSGIQASHFALKPNILKNYSRNFCSGQQHDEYNDTYGHGTRCAGIAAGRPFSSTEFHYLGGVAPKAKLIICKVCDEKTPKVKAVEDALQYICDLEGTVHVDVVSLSIGFRGIIPSLQDKIGDLAKNRTICVASAGNHASRYSNYKAVSCPASCQSTIAVGSHDEGGNPSQFTPKGDEVWCLTLGEKVCAPALDTPDQQGQMALCCCKGTSMAAPAVAGLVAIIIQLMNSVGRKNKVNFLSIERLLRKMTENKILRPCDFLASVYKNPNAAKLLDTLLT